MSEDLISRSKVIDALKDMPYGFRGMVENIIYSVPSAQTTHESVAQHVQSVGSVGDMISRQDAIDLAVQIIKEWHGLEEDDADAIKYKFMGLPSAQQWTPVTERLPKIENNTGKRVIVTTSWGLVHEAYYCVDHWEMNDIDYKLSSVTAWCPLPKRWEGGGE